jgi:hypothetical protein
MQNENALKTAILKSATWEDAVDDFIRCTTQLGQPFTSGHVTTILRVYRPELRFAHGDIGARCQDHFYNGTIDYSGMPAVQVPRVCAGLGRTPAGTTVFVYGADNDDADNFPFELDIPKPGAGLTQMPQEHPIQQNVQIQPKVPSKVDMRAKVHADHRLCVPRIAFEGLMHKTGRRFKAGDKAWVRFEDGPDRAIISLDQKPGAVDYDITKDRGRVLFPKAGAGRFQHGDIFAVDIVNDELVVDIATAL